MGSQGSRRTSNKTLLCPSPSYQKKHSHPHATHAASVLALTPSMDAATRRAVAALDSAPSAAREEEDASAAAAPSPAVAESAEASAEMSLGEAVAVVASLAEGRQSEQQQQEEQNISMQQQ